MNTHSIVCIINCFMYNGPLGMTFLFVIFTWIEDNSIILLCIFELSNVFFFRRNIHYVQSCGTKKLHFLCLKHAFVNFIYILKIFMSLLPRSDYQEVILASCPCIRHNVFNPFFRPFFRRTAFLFRFRSLS